MKKIGCHQNHGYMLMSKKVLVLPGDGIGQEVTASAVEVLDFIIDEFC